MGPPTFVFFVFSTPMRDLPSTKLNKASAELDKAAPKTARTDSKSASVRRAPGLVALLVLALGGAWWFRQHFLTVNRLLPAAPDVAAIDPKLRALGKRSLELQAAIAKSPQDVKKRWALADVYQKLHQPQLAAEQLKAIIALDPKSAEAHVGLANIELAFGRVRQAEAQYRDAARRFPKSADAWQGLATTLYHQRKYLEASEAGREAFRWRPGDANVLYIRGVSSIEMAMQYSNSQRHADILRAAQTGLKQVLGVWPDKGDIFYRLGRAHMGLKEPKSAIKYLRRAKELVPERLDVDRQLIEALSVSGNRPAALKVAEEAVQRHPQSAFSHDLLGQLLPYSGKPDAAERAYEAFKKAAELAPNDPDIRQRFATACMNLQKLDEAQVEYERVVQLDPHLPYPYQQLAKIYRRKGQSERAAQFTRLATGMSFNEQQLRTLETAIESQPRNVPLHLVLADRYRELGWDDLARTEYLLTLRLDAKNKRARAGLAALEKTQSRERTQAQAPSQPVTK